MLHTACACTTYPSELFNSATKTLKTGRHSIFSSKPPSLYKSMERHVYSLFCAIQSINVKLFYLLMKILDVEVSSIQIAPSDFEKFKKFKKLFESQRKSYYSQDSML